MIQDDDRVISLSGTTGQSECCRVSDTSDSNITTCAVAVVSNISVVGTVVKSDEILEGYSLTSCQLVSWISITAECSDVNVSASLLSVDGNVTVVHAVLDKTVVLTYEGGKA